MTPEENQIVERHQQLKHKARQLAATALKRHKSEVQQIESELELIADDLQAEGIDWRKEPGLMLALLKKRLGPEKEEDGYDKRVADLLY